MCTTLPPPRAKVLIDTLVTAIDIFDRTNSAQRKGTTQNHQRPSDRFVRARLRPATSLRTKAKSVNGLLRAVGRRGFSYASSAARVPTALKKLSQ